MLDLMPNLEAFSFPVILWRHFVDEVSNEVVKSHYGNYLYRFLGRGDFYPMEKAILVRGVVSEWRKRDQCFQITAHLGIVNDGGPFRAPVCIAVVPQSVLLTRNLDRKHASTLALRAWSSSEGKTRSHCYL